jgi:outer membrane receptor protein involved in Fe transport
MTIKQPAQGISYTVAVLFCALALLFVLPSAAAAQGTGQIRGQVINAQTGEPIPGVNVVVVGTQRGAATNEDGNYAITNVPVGTQEVRASLVGFTDVTKTDVLVTIDQATRVDFSLKQEVVEGEEVVVQAERDIMKKEVSGSQQVITSEEVLEAPVRELDNFLSKQAGVSENLSIRGGAVGQTGTIINGITFTSERFSSPDAAVPLSAIDQVSVTSGGFTAEHGNFRSGLIEITTKAGQSDAYHGRIDLSINNPHQKRFGRSLYDTQNYYLRPKLDPDVAFVGTGEAWSDDPRLQKQYQEFRGWNTLAEQYNQGKAPENQASPLDLYMWNAWTYTVEPPFEKLEAEGYTIPEEKKQKIRDHAHELEGSSPDWNVDFGFGGPVPLVSEFLGDATFYLSHQSRKDQYTQPVARDAVDRSTTMLSIQSNLSSSLQLTLHGLYKTSTGVLDVIKSHHYPSNLGQMMPADNVSNSSYMPSGQYLYFPGVFTPLDHTSGMLGLDLRHAIGSNTFWELSISGTQRSARAAPPWAKAGLGFDEFFEKGYNSRSSEPVITFGPIKLNEQPYGFSSGNQVVDGFNFNNYEQPYGSTEHRFAQVGPSWFDSTDTQQVKARFDVSSQVTFHHMLKGGVEVRYSNLNHDMRSAWFGHLRGNFTYFWDREPLTAGIYVQDQIEYEGMVANIGLRADYYDPGGKWPTGEVFSQKAYGTGGQRENLFNRWAQQDILEPVETHLVWSPRLGLSFPVTERTKFFFNYGHFRSPAPWQQMFSVRQRPRVGLYDLGNPNLAPPRTIAYETGVEYNLLDQYLIRLSGYYKDITGQSGSVEYTNRTGTVNYDSWENNNYQDILGLELSVNKRYGEWTSGWANFDLRYEKSGLTGRSDFFEDPSKSEQAGLYSGQESRFLPRPQFTGNIRLHTPDDWGPSAGGTHPFGGWMLSVLPTWQAGPYFTWNPLGKRHFQNNLQWSTSSFWDMRFSKRFETAGAEIQAYVEVSNVFNARGVLRGQAFASGSDRRDYLASLHLPMYDSPEFDGLRQNSPEGYYTPGDDEPGELRSSEKPYINNPNQMLWRSFAEPRSIWFGLTVGF